jgi:uncharacterized lipoprotein YmbA
MKKLNHLFLLAGVAAIMAGCASAPSKFYTLNATAKSDGVSAVPCAVLVGPVFVPSAVDRPQIIVNTGTNSVSVLEFNRWAAPLSENIARAVSVNLGVLLGTSRAATAPLPDFGPAYRVSIRIERFEGALGGNVLMDAVWTIRNPAATSVDSGRTVALEKTSDDSFDALAAAHSRAIAHVSTDIAAAIRVAEGGKK